MHRIVVILKFSLSIRLLIVMPTTMMRRFMPTPMIMLPMPTAPTPSSTEVPIITRFLALAILIRVMVLLTLFFIVLQLENFPVCVCQSDSWIITRPLVIILAALSIRGTIVLAIITAGPRGWARGFRWCLLGR